MDNLSNEIWKDVIGYETLYQVSNLGRVKSIGKANEHLLKGRDDTNGYLKVALYKNKICKNFKIHRLVAIAFIENKDNKPCVNHINANKTDNILENLEWCSYSENSLHSHKLGLQTSRNRKQ